MLGRAVGLAGPLAAVTVSVRHAVGAGTVRLLRSGSSETHFPFLGSDKHCCRSQQPGSHPSLAPAVSGGSRHWCPVKKWSKAQPKPAVTLLHSAGAFICAACAGGSAQPWGCKGLGVWRDVDILKKGVTPPSSCLPAHCWSWESGHAAFSLKDIKLLSLCLFLVSPKAPPLSPRASQRAVLPSCRAGCGGLMSLQPRFIFPFCGFASLRYGLKYF